MSASAIRVMIVEDDPIIAADLQDRLGEMTYTVIGPFATGEEACRAVAEGARPDLLLMDIQLAGQADGIETALKLRQYQIPLIFLTSNSDEATFARAKAADPRAFLSKPFRGRDLKHAIELAISRPGPAPASGEQPENTFVMGDRLFVRVKERLQRLFISDILWVEADDYYCRIVVPEQEFLVTKTLKKLEAELQDRPEFLRVHRSYLVNLTQIEQIGEINIHIGKRSIPISRSAREELFNRLNKI